MSIAPELLDRPEARAEAVEDLVEHARRGRLRVPPFQRGLRWGSQQVIDLFDSVYRGYPVGALLLSKRPAGAGRIDLGPLQVDAPERLDGWWVVDGQQRLTSLAAALARPIPLPRSPAPVDPYIVYFDPAEKTFHGPPKDGRIPEYWVPAPLLLDSARLSEFVTDWMPSASNRKDLLRALFEAGKRIREYKLPMYVIEGDNVELLKEIFFRINNSGKTLKWEEVHDALFGGQGAIPSTTTQLADELQKLGMGRPSPQVLTSCLVAIRGLDVTRPLAEHRRKNRDFLAGAAAEALPVLSQVLGFLRAEAQIPHLRLLPRSLILEVTARFFAKHPEPSSRSTILLTRWIWRVLMAEGDYEERTLRRHGVSAIGDDEEVSVQTLLQTVTNQQRFPVDNDRFDARSAKTRLCLIALCSLRPRSIEDQAPLDVARLIEQNDIRAFRQVIDSRTNVRGTNSVENRILLPGRGTAKASLISFLHTTKSFSTVVESHAISKSAASALFDGDPAKFLAERKTVILSTLETLATRLAGWDRSDRDRPSINYLRRVSRGDEE